MGQTPPQWPSFSSLLLYEVEERVDISLEAEALVSASSLLLGWGRLGCYGQHPGEALVFPFQPTAGQCIRPYLPYWMGAWVYSLYGYSLNGYLNCIERGVGIQPVRLLSKWVFELHRAAPIPE